jgi:purine catabolism regulator
MPDDRSPTDLPRPAAGQLTVGHLLEGASLAAARVVAGFEGLGRPVDKVGVLELADLQNVQVGQLVLTSAYPLLDTDLGALVETLAVNGAAGLGVKLAGYWQEMPAELRAAATHYGLPLLELPPGRFEDLVNPVLATVADRQAESLNQTAELYDRLAEQALRTDGLDAVARVLADALRAPVVIVDDQAEVIAASDGTWLVPGLAEQLLAAADAGGLTVDGRSFLVAPISPVTDSHGAICALGVEQEDAFARGALAQGAVVAGMHLVGVRRHVDAVYRRFEQEVLDELSDGTLDEQQAAERAQHIGWLPRQPYVVILAGRPSSAHPSGLRLTEVDLRAVVRTLSRSTSRIVRAFRWRSGLGVVLHLETQDLSPAASRAMADRAVRSLGQHLHDEAKGAKYAIGVARVRTEVTALASSLREAAIALCLAPPIRREAAHHAYFDDLGSLRLMGDVTSLADLERASRDELRDIEDGRTSGPTELPETLATLLAHNMRLTEASSELYFHYNTIRHRLARLRELLGDRLDHPLGRLTLSLALAGQQILALERTLIARDHDPGEFTPVEDSEMAGLRSQPRLPGAPASQASPRR